MTEDEIRLMRRAETPSMLRDMVNEGHQKIVVSMDAATALNMANDIEFAVEHRPLPGSGDVPPSES